jgi:hypothetical protein
MDVVKVGAAVHPWLPQGAFPFVSVLFLLIGLGFTIFFLK